MKDASSPAVPPPELLERYLTGTATRDERAIVSKWIAEYPAAAAMLSELQDMRFVPQSTPPASLSRGRQLLQARLGFEPHASAATSVPASHPLAKSPARRTERGGSPVGVRRWTSPLFRGSVLAAGFATVVLAGAWWFRAGTSSDAAVHEYHTAAGERTTVTLADGSQVTLGPASTLRVPRGFGEDVRHVMLHGNGHFQVSHTEGRPFMVDAGNARVRVLGTSFAVRHYDTEPDVVVAVQTGKVGVQATSPNGVASQEQVATANDVIRVSGATAETRHAAADVEALTGWTSGRLQFNNVPLREVIPELERWYDVSIRLSDPALAHLRLSGGMSTHSLQNLEDMLQFVLSVSVSRAGRVLTLSPRGQK